MPSDSMLGEARLAELLAALSLAIDLGMGQKQEHVLRTCLLAVTLARPLDLNTAAISPVNPASADAQCLDQPCR